MKKIGFVVNAPIKYSETFLREEFQLMESLGYKVILFEGPGKTEEKIHFERVKALPNTYCDVHDIFHIVATLLPIFTFRLGRTIRFIFFEIKSGADIVRTLKRVWFNAHILNNKVDYLHFCFAEVAIQKELAAKAINAKMSVSLRGSDILIYPKQKENCYNRLWEHVNKVHAVSNWVYDHALELNLSPNTPNQIIYDFVNSGKIEFNKSDIGTPLSILTVGRLIAIKEHELAVEVIYYLKRLGLQVELIIVGEGPKRELIERKVSELNLSNHVKLYGKLNHSEVLKLMSKSDIYIHTSRSEGFNVSLLEAQAAGLLTFSLDAGSTNENIEEGKSGWIILDRSVEGMVRQINEIINSSAHDRQEVKLYARERIERLFDKKSRLVEWKKFFEI